MAQRSEVPKFGNWESEENVPYTAYFEKARKNRSGGKMNPKASQENPDMLSDKIPPVQAHACQQDAVRSRHEHQATREDRGLGRLSDSPLHPASAGERASIDLSDELQVGVSIRSGGCKSESETPKGPDALRPGHERWPSREDSDLGRATDSPLRHETVARKTTGDSPYHRHNGLSSGDTPRRATRQSLVSDHSIEQSPLHPHHPGRVGGKCSGISSPSWDRKGSSEGNYGLAPSTPVRSRLKSVNQGDVAPDHGPAIPKFGDWDENDPASAEGYSHIFERVREERHTEAGKVPPMVTDGSYPRGQEQYGNKKPKKCCCFPWGRK